MLTQREGMLQEQLVEKDGGGRTVLHLAALSGDRDNLAAAIDIVAKHLDESQAGISARVYVFGRLQEKWRPRFSRGKLVVDAMMVGH